MSFTPSTSNDLEQISEWIAADPDHAGRCPPEYWLTGAEGSMLSFCLMDDKGPLAYIRLDKDGDLTRLHTQFAPEEVVSKRRLIIGMLKAFEIFIPYLKTQSKGIIFNSISPLLIAFMKKQDFKEASNDDYVLAFEEQT